MSYYSRVDRVARPHARPQALDRVILLVPEPEPHDVPLDAILNDNGVVWPV